MQTPDIVALFNEWVQLPGKSVFRMTSNTYHQIAQLLSMSKVTTTSSDWQSTLENCLRVNDKILVVMAPMTDNVSVCSALQLDPKYWNAWQLPLFEGNAIRITCHGNVEVLPGLNDEKFKAYMQQKRYIIDCSAQLWTIADNDVCNLYKEFVGQAECKYLEIRFNPLRIEFNLSLEFRDWIAKQNPRPLIADNALKGNISFTDTFGTNIVSGNLKTYERIIVELEARFCASFNFCETSRWFEVEVGKYASNGLAAPGSIGIKLNRSLDPAFFAWLGAHAAQEVNTWDLPEGQSVAHCANYVQAKFRLQELDEQITSLHERYLESLTVKRKWSTLYHNGKLQLENPEPEFIKWLAVELGSAPIKPSDICARNFETRASLLLDKGNAQDLAIMLETRLDELLVEYKAQPLMRVTKQEMAHFCLKATPDFVNFTNGKTFAGVKMIWLKEDTAVVGISAGEPIIWNTNFRNLGLTSDASNGTVCPHELVPKLMDAIDQAHQAWEIPHTKNVRVFGKTPITVEQLEPVQGYCVKYLKEKRRYNSRLQIVGIMKEVEVALADTQPTTRNRVVMN